MGYFEISPTFLIDNKVIVTSTQLLIESHTPHFQIFLSPTVQSPNLLSFIYFRTISCDPIVLFSLSGQICKILRGTLSFLSNKMVLGKTLECQLYISFLDAELLCQFCVFLLG